MTYDHCVYKIKDHPSWPEVVSGGGWGSVRGRGVSGASVQRLWGVCRAFVGRKLDRQRQRPWASCKLGLRHMSGNQEMGLPLVRDERHTDWPCGGRHNECCNI